MEANMAAQMLVFRG